MKRVNQLAKFFKPVNQADTALTVDESVDLEKENVTEANEDINKLPEISETFSLEKRESTEINRKQVSKNRERSLLL